MSNKNISQDASFEDGHEAPLNLMVIDADDLGIVSALLQDAVFPATEMRWQKSQARFAVLLNRFRWEDKTAAQRRGRAPERVQAMLVIDDVMRVQSQGNVQGDERGSAGGNTDMVLSLLAISFVPGKDGMGRLELTLAGDGAIALDVEALNLTLRDVTRPYIAPSHKVPQHD